MPSRRRRGALAQCGLRPQHAERVPAVLVVRAVDDQHTVEVVELVLDGARGEAVELEAHLLPGGIPALEDHVRRPRDRDADALERQASLLLSLSLRGRLDEPRVDDGVRAVLALAPSKTNSRWRTPTCVAARPTPWASAISSIIRSASWTQVVVELGHLAGLHPERDVRVLPDLGQRAWRRIALRLLLRLEVGLVVLVVVLVLVLMVVLVVVLVAVPVLVLMLRCHRRPSLREAVAHPVGVEQRPPVRAARRS